jgi:small subunit ribosomal protein S13
MLYILETKLSEKKPVLFALTSIYGINKSTASSICKKLGFSLNLKIKNLTQEQVQDMLIFIESLNLMLNQELKTFRYQASKTLISIKAYRGLRKVAKLPVRGQRTHTNAKSAKKFRF